MMSIDANKAVDQLGKQLPWALRNENEHYLLPIPTVTVAISALTVSPG